MESIRKTTKSDYKIYIVDNNSANDSYIKLYSTFNNCCLDVVLIESKTNGGYSVGNNIGIKKALSDGANVVILSNSDIIYFENSIDSMYTYLNNNKNIGILGPKVILENNEIQESPRKNYTFNNYIFGKKPFIYFDYKYVRKNTYFDHYKYDNDLVFKGLVSGCCIALTKEYFEICGLLDDNIFLYYEESIIAHKAFNTNLHTCILPSAVVLHKSSVSIGNPDSAFSRYHRYYSSMYMLKKYVKISNLKLLLVFLINFIPFLINSISKKEYRDLMLSFIKKCLKLFFK
ncbi:Glycosyl transferase family 2 [compost metagenome]